MGLEIAEQCADLDVTPDDVVVPCSGGGLVAGIALALEARIPGARLDGGACGFDDHQRSLAAGRRVRNSG